VRCSDICREAREDLEMSRSKATVEIYETGNSISPHRSSILPSSILITNNSCHRLRAKDDVKI
jgi:hypothetical protein